MNGISIGDDAGRYEIRVAGRLDPRWSAWFDGMTLSRRCDGSTVIHGEVVDQSALHGLLTKVRDTGLPLISVTRVAPRPDVAPSADTHPTARIQP
ncbi:MAG: hypothetical protein ABJA16_00370 [Nakamurella sp.]